MSQPAKAVERKNYGPVPSLVITIFTFFGAQFLAVLLVALVPYAIGLDGVSASSWYKDNPLAQFLLIATTGIINFLVISWFLRKKSIGLKQIGLNKPQLKYAGIALFGFGLYFIVYLISVGLISALIPGLDIQQEQELGFNKTQTGVGLMLVFVSLVIIPPLVEEFVMRGFLFSGLRSKLSFYYATIITSVLFAVAHLPGGKDGLLWIGAVDTFVLAIVLCYLRERYKSIWPPIGVHMLKNGLAFTIVFLLSDTIR